MEKQLQQTERQLQQKESQLQWTERCLERVLMSRECAQNRSIATEIWNGICCGLIQAGISILIIKYYCS